HRGERDGQQIVIGGVERTGEEREHGGLSTAALGEDHGDCVAFEGEAQATERLLDSGVAKQGRFRSRAREGRATEREVLFESHGGEPPCWGLGFFAAVRMGTTCSCRASG